MCFIYEIKKDICILRYDILLFFNIKMRVVMEGKSGCMAHNKYRMWV